MREPYPHGTSLCIVIHYYVLLMLYTGQCSLVAVLSAILGDNIEVIIMSSCAGPALHA